MSHIRNLTILSNNIASISGSQIQLTGSVYGSQISGTVAQFTSLDVTNLSADKITAREYHTELVSASIIYQSGSTKFGDTPGGALQDIHQFSGSVYITGSTVTLTGGTFNGALIETLTFNDTGGGGTSGTTFNNTGGSSSKIISYNTIGAPSTTGLGASGTWGISITGNATTATTSSAVLSEDQPYNSTDAKKILFVDGNGDLTGPGEVLRRTENLTYTPNEYKLSCYRVTGTIVSASNFTGRGSGITNLDADNISNGILNSQRGGTGYDSYTNGQLLIGRSSDGRLYKANLDPGTGISITNGAGTIEIAATNNGTVTDVSVASSNGFAGSVANSTTTPVITLSTTVTGILYGNGLGGFSSVTIGTGLSFANGILSNSQIGLIDGDKGDITVGSIGATWTINNNVVSNAKLRDSNPTSVIGRSANNLGDPADIQATADNQVLRRSAGTLGFGKLANDSLTNSSVTIGDTPVSLGATVTTFTGLDSVTSTGFTGSLNGNADTATTATDATNVAVTNDGTTNTNFYIPFVADSTGNTPIKVDDAGGVTYNPSTGYMIVGGRLGIGLTPTGAPLDVNGNGLIRGELFTGTSSAEGDSTWLVRKRYDTDTGLYSSGANKVSLGAGGAQQLEVVGATVGINKLGNSPNATLDVNGNTIVSGTLTVTQGITADSFTGSLQGNATSATTATESQFILLPTSIEFDETSYDENLRVNDPNWISPVEDVIKQADTGTYSGQKFLVLKEPFVGLRLKRPLTGSSTVSYFAARNAGSGFYDSAGLNLSQSVSGDDLVLQYSTNGTTWTDYATAMTGNVGSGLEVTSSAISVTGISGLYYLRFAQTSSTETEYPGGYSVHYEENFESLPGSWSYVDSAVVSGDGSLATPYAFRRKTGGTDSTATGPTGAYSGSYYIYTEASNPAVLGSYYESKRVFTSSESSDFSYLSFYYHAYGDTIGTLLVQISTDSGNTWNSLNITKDVDGTPSTVSSISGQQHPVQADPWLRAIVDLEAYRGTAYTIRFLYRIALSGTSFNSDFAIDGIEFLDYYAQYAIKDVIVSYNEPVLAINGHVSASSFIGDGSQLTNLAAGSERQIQFHNGSTTAGLMATSSLYWDNTSQKEGLVSNSTYIGRWTTNPAYAGFYNKSLAKDGSNYALIQSQTGGTFLNSAANHDLTFKIGNTTKAYISGLTSNFVINGNLHVGSSNDLNYIGFHGTTSDGTGDYNHSFIAERIYSPATEKSELLIFKANDVSDTSGKDRIRLAAAEIRFDTYNSALPYNPAPTIDDYATNTAVINRMVIASDGKVGIGGIESPLASLHISGSSTNPTTFHRDTYATLIVDNEDSHVQIASTDHGDKGSAMVLTNGSYHWYLHNAPGSGNDSFELRYLQSTGDGNLIDLSSVKMSLTTSGNLTVYGTITELSTRRVKKNIRSLGSQLDKIKKLNPVSYRRKEIKDSKKEMGFISEEVKEVYPELVSGEGVNYSKMVSILVSAVKELTEKVEQQEKEIKNLKRKAR